MAAIVLADTGPLVALFDRAQNHHAWAVAALAQLRDPLITCDAVLTEATYLLRPGTRRCDALMESLERGTIISRLALEGQVSRIRGLIQRYENVPMSFADACLVRMTELVGDVRVWTLDADFRVYRRHGRQAIPTLSPTF